MREGRGDGEGWRALSEAVGEVLGVELGRERAERLLAAYRRRLGGEAEPWEEGEEPGREDGLRGSSVPVRELMRKVARVARVPETVLILGENGTGKELVARAVHRRSPRAGGPFISQNCSALAETLLDSALFGHVRGAFTGAVADRKGLFEAAHGGTLFLDEVGEMSPALQAKLLRVLEDSTLVPVGAVEPRRVDVRVVAATNRDLRALVRAGRFREDLWHRLGVLTLQVPPLRERPGDVERLVDHFLGRLAARDGERRTLSAECRERPASYGWPGNVRELEHEVERLWVFSGGEVEIGVEWLSPEIREAGGGERTRAGLHASVEALERRQIEEALRRSGGNRTHAAAALGVSRRNLIRKIRRFGLA